MTPIKTTTIGETRVKWTFSLPNGCWSRTDSCWSWIDTCL